MQLVKAKSGEITTREINAWRILIVEDNPADAHLTKLALKRQGVTFEVVVVDDGEPAISFLKAESPYEDAGIPHLVVLDLNLKRMDGLDVLRWIRATPKFSSVKVVVLSSSPADAHLEAAAKANVYLEKPGNLEAYMDIGRVLRECLDGRIPLL